IGEPTCHRSEVAEAHIQHPARASTAAHQLSGAFQATSTARAVLITPRRTATRNEASHDPAGSGAAATTPSTPASVASPVSTAVTARTRVMLVSVGLGRHLRISAGTQPPGNWHTG